MLRRAGLAEHFELQCCGPGAAGIASWAARQGEFTTRPVILAGLAGSLSPAVRRGSAAIITAVVDSEGQQHWTPSLSIDPGTHSHGDCIITSSGASLLTIDSKHAMKAKTGAALVDLESIAFARHAQAAGWNWGIVRGVSDDLEMALPTGADSWVNAHGATRLSAVLGAVVRQPALVPRLWKLRRDSGLAMGAVARLLAGFHDG